MTTADIPQLRALSRDEKISLVEQLWDEIATAPNDFPLSPRLEKIADAAADDHARDPRGGSPWPEVKARILRS